MAETAADFFGARADGYEDYIARIVPAYHEINALIVRLAPFAHDARLRALDVGAGTGVLSDLLLGAFPNMTLVALDMSEAMLAQCAERLRRHGERARIRQGRFPDADIGDGYDLVVSSLALHHLSHDDKRAGFRRLFTALSPGGAFLLRDVVAAPAPSLEAVYEALWRTFVQAHGHDDLSWFEAHLEEDNPARVEDQIDWLAEAGFAEPVCHWRHLNVALIGARKPAG
jgi:tRNA (cmo5U34)-methyltransferase